MAESRVGRTEPREPSVRRVNVNFSDSAMTTLRDLAARKGTSISAVLRDAIALEKWFDDQARAGATFLLESKDGTWKELILR